MKITIVGRQVEVTEELRQLFDKKLSKFEKFFKDDAVAYITLKKEHNFEILELTISSGGTLYRSEEKNSTFNNALDEAIEAIERQIRKNKTRLEKRLREGAFVKDVLNAPALAADTDEESDFEIRVKTFPIKPMSAEEAILQMNLLGHEFFVFEHDETGEVSVVYKRNNKKYGMIVPEK
jgi:ribosomal subunit interface protein